MSCSFIKCFTLSRVSSVSSRSNLSIEFKVNITSANHNHLIVLTLLAHMKSEIHLDYCTHTRDSFYRRLHRQWKQYFSPPVPYLQRISTTTTWTCQPQKMKCNPKLSVQFIPRAVCRVRVCHMFCWNFDVFDKGFYSLSYSDDSSEKVIHNDNNNTFKWQLLKNQHFLTTVSWIENSTVEALSYRILSHLIVWNCTGFFLHLC